MNNALQFLVAFVVGLVVTLAISTAHAESILIRQATVHTVSDSNVLENTDILIDEGVIQNIGADLVPPDGARLLDGRGKIVTPGFFVGLSALGLEEINLDYESNDTQLYGTPYYGAVLDAVDAYNPASSVIPVTRVGGVTRAFISPLPGEGLFGGQGAVIDLSGAPASVTRPRAAQNLVLGYAGANRAGSTRLGAWALLRTHINHARLYAADPVKYARDMRVDEISLVDVEALGPVAEGVQPLIVEVHRASEIRKLIELKWDYDLRIILYGAREAWQVAEELAAADIGVIVNPLDNLPVRFESLGATLENAARLHKAGVKIAFYDNDIGFTHNVRLLPHLAGNAIAHGLPYDAAMEAVTINPAEMFDVADKVGTLELGKAADIVVWDGDPFEVTTRPTDVIINGEIMPMTTRQSRLRERYRDLSRGDLPPAYPGLP